jgi:hypothetical protein
VALTDSPRFTEIDESPFLSAPSVTANVTSPDVMPEIVKAGEPPGTLSPFTTV